jgi:hypothetical protein
MAGGKETPRQKMIGMMYLVLTALLALNVSKQIVGAFITLNNKLDASAEIIQTNASDSYGKIDKKKAGIIALNGELTDLKIWEDKAFSLKKETASLVGFLLSECNEMIKESEGVDWIEDKDDNGNITKLKSLSDINGMDNYDIPTNMFVGGNPNEPNKRGIEIVNRIHEFRNLVCEIMGNYSTEKKKFTFTAPSDAKDLPAALKTVNSVDTASIIQFYNALTVPAELVAHGEEKMMPWISVTFDHAPIVAAAAMFTSLKLDVKNAEAMAAEYIVGKIEAPIFDFNKIEPMAMASSAYINQGDSLGLKVKIAAYDTNKVTKIRWGMDKDTLAENWTETTGDINLAGSEPGAHRVKGVIGVSEKGETTWKPWEFNYTVGQPMGVVAQPKMRVLYWGYDNVVEATASGFPSESVSMSGNGCKIEKKGNEYVAKVTRGTRSANISVNGQNEDGTRVGLGSFTYKCVPLPKPELRANSIQDGSTVSYTEARNLQQMVLKYDQSVTLTGVEFKIRKGQLNVEGINGAGKINRGGTLDATAKQKLRQCRGKSVTIEVEYEDPAGTVALRTMRFKVRG